LGSIRRDQIGKAEVVRQEHTLLKPGLLQDRRIGQPVQAQSVKMHSLMHRLAQKGHCLWRDAHIGQESHAEAASWG